MAESTWVPVVGEWVTYSPTGGRPEDGEVKSVDLERGTAMVLYRGDTTAKTTYLRDLRPGRPTSAW